MYLLIEPFYSGSHKQLIDLLKKIPGTHAVTLPGKKWHWKARTSALYLSQVIPHNDNYTSMFASSVLNMAELVALRPDLACLHKVLYFHENQLVYPVRKSSDRDFQYGYNQILSSLVADVLLFNSKYNKKSFLSNINTFLKMIPYERPRNIAEQLRHKCHVLHFPMEFPCQKSETSSCPPTSKHEASDRTELCNNETKRSKDTTEHCKTVTSDTCTVELSVKQTKDTNELFNSETKDATELSNNETKDTTQVDNNEAKVSKAISEVVNERDDGNVNEKNESNSLHKSNAHAITVHKTAITEATCDSISHAKHTFISDQSSANKHIANTVDTLDNEYVMSEVDSCKEIVNKRRHNEDISTVESQNDLSAVDIQLLISPSGFQQSIGMVKDAAESDQFLKCKAKHMVETEGDSNFVSANKLESFNNEKDSDLNIDCAPVQEDDQMTGMKRRKIVEKDEKNLLSPLHIVWPHRWEHDKGPESFFKVIFQLQDAEVKFKLSVLGENFSEIPVFETAKTRLKDVIAHWGYLPTKEDYYDVLRQADCVISTANHEFFGVAMLEAVHLGCFPLCPNRLVYPEIFPKECLYNTDQQLFKKLREFCRRPNLLRKKCCQVDTKQYEWERLKVDFVKYICNSSASTDNQTIVNSLDICTG